MTRSERTILPPPRRSALLGLAGLVWLGAAGIAAAGSAVDGVRVRPVPLADAETPGEHAHAAIAAIEETYEEVYFSRGRSIHDMRGTGYHPWWRIRHHFEQRQDHAGRYDPRLRWERYREIRASSLRGGVYLRAAAWEEIGPVGFSTSEAGRMLCAAFEPGNPSTIYAGSSAAGLWRSQDDGQSWVPLTDQLPSMRVSSVAIDPADPSRIVIGTGTGYASTIMLAPGVGVLLSTDSGVTWDLTSFAYAESNGVSTYRLAWDALDPSRLYLAATNGVWRSTDKGVSWSLVLAGDASDVELHPAAAGLLYAALDGGGLHRSTDAGDTWELLQTGLPPLATSGRTSLSLCESQPTTIYASIADPGTFALTGLYRTDDGGDTWARVDSAPDYLCSSPGSGCVGWLFNVIGVAPHDPDLLIAGGVRLFRSDDGGASWTWHDYLSNGIGTENPGLVYVDDFAVEWHPTDPQRVLVLNDGGVWESRNAGLWWEPRNQGLATALLYRIGVDPQDADHVAAGLQDHGHAARQPGAGNAWPKWSYGDGGEVIVHAGDGQIVYGVLQFGQHIKSLDGGSSLVLPLLGINAGILESAPFIAETVVDPTNPQALYHASNARIYRTLNGGSLWAVSADLPNVRTLAVDHVDSDVVYAHAWDNSTWHLYRSTDAGGSWTGITHPSIPTWRVTDLETHPTQAGVVYATRNSAFPGNDHVKRSTDFGETWTDITGDLPDIPTNAIAVSPHTAGHLYLATDLGVFVTENGGATWQEWNDGLPVIYVSDVEYHAASRTVTVATKGRGAWRSPALDSAVDAPLPPARPGFALAPPRPNPFRSSVSLELTLDRPAAVKAAVFNALGQRVATLVEGVRAPGDHALRWDGRNLHGRPVSAGSYFVRVEVDGVAQGRRVQLVR